MQNEILVIFTGGTIACPPPGENEKRDVAASTSPSAQDFLLLRRYTEIHSRYIAENGITFSTRKPLSTLSEHLTTHGWNKLIGGLKRETADIETGKYAGIIITHGTDTLSYTAALLSILLSHLTIPCLLVSSCEPLHSPAANGHKNFADAVSFICSHPTPGVFVPFSYDNARTILYDAAQIKASQVFIHKYESRTGVDYGYIADGRLVKSSWDDNSARKHKGANLLDMVGELENNVMIIHPYIGLDYSRLNISGNVRAVLHSTYHSSTFCLSGLPGEEKNSIKYLQQACDENNAALYLAPYEHNAYADDAEFSKIPDCTLELAYAKLLVGLNIYGQGIELDKFLTMQF